MSAWWSKNRRLILQLAGTLLAVILLAALLRGEGWSEITAAFTNIKPADLLWVAFLFIISRLATAARWHILLRAGGVNIRYKDSLALTFTGLFASNFLPTTIGGDMVRLAGVMRMGFDRAVCLASIAADRLIGMLGMSMTLPLGLVHAWKLLGAAPASSLTFAWSKRPLAFLKRTLSVFTLWLRQPASLLVSLAFTWVHMLCLFGSISILTADLETRIPFWMIAGLWSLTYFITQIPISINGYGLQELSFTFLLSNAAGLSPAASLSVAVLIRAFFILTSLPGALFLPFIVTVMAEQKTGALPRDNLL
jgi:uncharacterized membrane protein YbhN (UPF0104 family)